MLGFVEVMGTHGYGVEMKSSDRLYCSSLGKILGSDETNKPLQMSCVAKM